MNAIEGLTVLGVVIALGVAVVGWAQANRAGRRATEANDHAAEANRIADNALELAKAADERADRFEVQSLESRDVTWEQIDKDDHDRVTFRNVGADKAHDVRLTVEPVYRAWPRRSEPHGTVEGGGRIAMNLATEVQEEQTRWRRDMDATQPGDPVFISVASLHVRVRVNWTSASGIPGSQAFPEIVL